MAQEPYVVANFREAMDVLSDPTRLIAGAEYAGAVMALGLDPDLMCWVYQGHEKRAELAVVTTMVDRVGPRGMYELLFKAYDHSATPKEIDPFVVGIYSPRSALGGDLLNNIRVDQHGLVAWDINVDGRRPHLFQVMYTIGITEPKIVVGPGIYRVKVERRNADQDRSRWNTFRENVDRLAA